MSPRQGINTSKVIEVAIKIADEEGLESVTIATLAKELNIRPPSLYNHISGLSEVHQALSFFGLEQLYKYMIKESESLTKEAAIHGLAKGYIDFARKHPGLYAATLTAPNGNSDLQIAGESVVTLVINALSFLKLDEETMIHSVRGLRSILHGFASLEQQMGFGIPLDLDESIHYTIETFLQGCGRKVK